MKRFAAILSMFFILGSLGCKGGAVKDENLGSILDGTFVGNAGSLVIKLTLNGADKTFKYAESGGMTKRNYRGTFAVLGPTVIFTSSDGIVAKHKASTHAGGFTLTCIENMKPISFKFEPLGQGEQVKFFKQ